MRDAGALGFSILGRRFEAHGVSAPLAGWLRRFWHFPEHSGHAPASEYRISLEVMEKPPSSVERGDVGHEDMVATIAPGWRGRDDAWETGTPTAGVRLSLGVDAARVLGWGFDDTDVNAELPDALQLALCEALRASGLMPLHAAVAARDSDVVAFLAPSGTGKSTALVHAVRAGWMPVAEDFAWLHPETLAVYGWDRGIRLWPEWQAAVDGVTTERWLLGADGKLFLDYTAFGPSVGSRRGKLSRLALLVRDGSGPPGREPLPPHEAVRALWEATGVPLAPRARAWTAAQVPRVLACLETERRRL